MDRERLLDSLVKKLQTKELQTLGIYGHGGSGKTTFTKALCKRLDPTKVNLLETDPYIIGKSALCQIVLMKNFRKGLSN